MLQKMGCFLTKTTHFLCVLAKAEMKILEFDIQICIKHSTQL
jgi:hypothetical protein